jgi:hypothetical protein
LSGRRAGAASSFSPASLFAAGEQGAWFDPSDLTTMFQDTLGLIPVTAPGQTVARINDKSGRGNHATQATLALRPTYGIVPLGGRRNLLTYTEQFDNAVWVKANSGTGVLPTVSANSSTAPDGSSNADLITISRSSTTGLSFLVHRLPDDGSQKARSFYIKAANSVDVGKVLDTWTFDTAVGNRTAVTLTADWVRVNLPAVTLSAGAVREPLALGFLDNGSLSPSTGTVQFLIWGAQLELGSTATAYQKVTNAFDVTEAGVASLSYLSFDGVDDFLVTPTITPNIDKAQVFAGVRNLSDAVIGMLLETSANVGANTGSLYVVTGPDPSAANRYSSISRGSAAVGPSNVATTNLGNAPDTAILSTTHDIAGDLTTIRRNGVAGTSATVDLGAGNFLAYPLYIGRRGGTNAPFSGNIYSLIVRFGANLAAGTITDTETWVNGKTGAY